MVGTFIGIFFCYGVLDPISNMMKQLVNGEASTMETVKVVLCTHVAGKPPLLAIDAGRRLIQLNTKPSFAQLEAVDQRHGRRREQAAPQQPRGGRGNQCKLQNDKAQHAKTIVKRGGGKQHHDEHGGAWKVAFADFCLALMALFLVLWLMAAREARSDQEHRARHRTPTGPIQGRAASRKSPAARAAA
jgi:hypothetical protein